MRFGYFDDRQREYVITRPDTPLPWINCLGWNYVAIAHWILGIRVEYDGLRVDPAIPPEWKGFTAVRRFRGNTYEIQVTNPAAVNHGVKRLKVDGVEGHTVPVRPTQPVPIQVTAVLEAAGQASANR